MKTATMQALKQHIFAIETATRAIEDIQSDMQEQYDNMSEGQQESERGEQLAQECEELLGAYNDLDNITARLEELVQA